MHGKKKGSENTMNQIFYIETMEIELECDVKLLVFSNIPLQPGNVLRISGNCDEIQMIEPLFSIDQVVETIKREQALSHFENKNEIDWAVMRTANVAKSADELDNIIGTVEALEFIQV